MAIDVSGLGYFLPILGFMFVFIIVYALLDKTKILGGNKFINLLIGFIIATVFATLSSAQEYVERVTPWFAVLVIVLFFILLVIGMSQQKVADIMKPSFVWVFIIALILIFLVSAIKVWPSFFGDIWDDLVRAIDNESRVAGAIILLVIGALTAWVIAKK